MGREAAVVKVLKISILTSIKMNYVAMKAKVLSRLGTFIPF